MEKHISFSAPIKKEHDKDKTITYKKILLILADSCQVNYQVLLTNYLKLILKTEKHP